MREYLLNIIIPIKWSSIHSLLIQRVWILGIKPVESITLSIAIEGCDVGGLFSILVDLLYCAEMVVVVFSLTFFVLILINTILFWNREIKFLVIIVNTHSWNSSKILKKLARPTQWVYFWVLQLSWEEMRIFEWETNSPTLPNWQWFL